MRFMFYILPIIRTKLSDTHDINYPQQISDKLSIIIMGLCVSKDQYKTKGPTKRGQINIICPICEEGYNTGDRKPLLVCENRHSLCQECFQSLKKHAVIKKKTEVECPFCKKPCFQNLIQTDKEEATLKKLPEDRKKLYAFSTVYLPSLHKLIKEELMMKEKDKKKQDRQLMRIDCIKIRGKMLEEYEIFEMDMLECLTNLKRLYLNHNQIKALDLSEFTHDKLQLLDLTKNNFAAMKMLTDHSEPFKHIRILNFESNQIENIKGLRRLEMLQVLNLKRNKITSMAGLQELKSLVDLNIQFNLIQKFQYQPYFNEIRSLSLLGNKFPESTWQQFVKHGWQQLRLLTLTVNKVLFQKSAVHSLLKESRWNYLQLIISEIVDPQLEDMSAIDEKGFAFDNLAIISIGENMYEFYGSEKQSFLAKAVKKIKEFDRLGVNVNFRPYLFNSSSYQINENLNVVSRVKDYTGPADYVYHSKAIKIQDNGYKFIRFKSNTSNIAVGICQQIPPLEQSTLSIDLQKGVVNIGGEKETVERLKRPVKESEEWECIFRVNLAQQALSLLINGAEVYVLNSVSIDKEVIFFVQLVEKDSKFKIVTLQSSSD